MTAPLTPRSRVVGVEWPALLGHEGATVLALVHQLDQSERWAPERIREHQLLQLDEVVRHARATVPHYELALAELDGPLTMESWARIPILSRAELVDDPEAFVSRVPPPSHGETVELASSRTTGKPVRVLQSRVAATLWMAFTLRDHRWHRRDLSGHLAALRYTPPDDTASRSPSGVRALGWGPSVDLIYPPAPLSLMNVGAPLEQQVAWLLREDPHYLLIYPTVLGSILRRLEETGERPRRLREVRTVSEALSEDTRALSERVLGVPLVDTYSAQEVGYIALQCPEHTHYHVQSENVLVEVLGDDDRPCAPGSIGRVVVSALHNFATPLLRYDIGDYAVVGEPCPCGRGLPVLERVVGRRRGMLSYPDGKKAWPLFTVACREAARYREIQLEQSPDLSILVRIVPDGPFGEEQRAALLAALARCFDHTFDVTFEIVDALPRGATGKLEELISHA